MIITIGSGKGGVGKTGLALAIALVWKDFGYGTNETFHEFGAVLGTDRVLACSPFKDFPDFASEQIDVIFDLSGDVNEKSFAVASAVEQSHVVVIPMTADKKSIHAAANYVMTVAPMNQNIILVANILEKQGRERFDSWEDSYEYQMIRETLNKKLPAEFQNLPMFPIKKSKAFKAVEEQGVSIQEIMDSNPLLKYNYKLVNEQLNTLMEAIIQYE
jgi:cellulose biosynthesis protein BcsQ